MIVHTKKVIAKLQIRHPHVHAAVVGSICRAGYLAHVTPPVIYASPLYPLCTSFRDSFRDRLEAGFHLFSFNLGY